MRKVLTLVLSVIMVLSLVACEKSKPSKNQFGYFSVNGKTLISLAENELSYESAKAFVTRISSADNEQKLLSASRDTTLSTDEINRILSTFGGLEIDYMYYDLSGDEKSGSFKLEGSDLANHVTNGSIPLFYGILITDIVINLEVLEYYQEQNTLFKTLPNYNVFPFSNIYTYHQTFDGKSFVLQVHDFTELPNSIGYASGFSSTYLKENEVVYDGESRLITTYQTAQGIKIQYPDGTGFYGALFRADFNWIPKTNNN
ncbi:hypothetical protein N7548_01530 [Acholeplasma manati]|uniref:Uncharacterized protein n=1 Tax=Paracholeplasma manati TaxID=591373 RepID=A0ABT2Y450_9MOLU|nr:hypothetical protein [Paracholeplasma manati]MCV2231509.1 hypothetical protein [Paracholeplasma manati]